MGARKNQSLTTAPKLKSCYGVNGWNPVLKARVDALELPKKLKCNYCNKLEPTAVFSENQIKTLKEAIIDRRQREVTLEGLQDHAWIRCRKCIGTQPTEMECVICGQVKGFDGFAKAQRKDKEHARCMECVAEHQSEKPIEGLVKDHEFEEGYDSGDDVSNAHEDSDFDESEAGGAPLSSHFLNEENLRSFDDSTGGNRPKPSASRASTVASFVYSSRAPSGMCSAALGKWQTMSRDLGGTNADLAAGARFTGYDPDGVAHQRPRSPSTIADDEYDRDSDVTATTEQPHNTKAFKEQTSKFAKLKGPRKEPVKPTRYPTRTLPNQNEYEDEDDVEVGEDEDDYFVM